MSPKPLSVAMFCLLALTVANAADVKQDPQAEAEALLNRARQISEIRSPNAPSFVLKAAFSIVGEELETFEGTYTEFWVSDSRWRREITVKNSQQVEVGTPTRLWVQENEIVQSAHADRVSRALMMFPSRSSKLKFGAVKDVSPTDSSVRCAVTKPIGPDEAKNAYCFDSKMGALVENISPERLKLRLGDYSCGYDNFKKLGDFFFPYDVDCKIEGHNKLQVHVVSLSSETPDASLFNPPSGALEIGRCMEGLVPPKAENTPSPNFSPGLRGSAALVVMNFIVDVKGKTQNVRAVSSTSQAFGEMAVETVKRWKFKPATCDGERMPFRLNVELKFNSYH